MRGFMTFGMPLIVTQRAASGKFFEKKYLQRS